MSWLTDVFSGGVGNLVKNVGEVVDNFQLSGEEKQRLKLEMQQLVQQRESEIEETIRSELRAKERVLVAELQQGDNYTKRARPSVVYSGLVFIFFNYVLVPTIQSLAGVPVRSFDLPVEFWAAWGGIVATWTIGRTAEKRGASNRLTRTITGNKKPVSILEDEPAKG
ncbi:MAG: holin family protein [Candidatus Marinimicrobia bacterium]|nr:holin family protein [Candidatus Neomarinimicrobiota bacterium]MCF7829389.1 holin family protein [Candidatus Neomarinimicrobiota bacterium]MCF7880875.1 holin family protein [Candidatus Neomarinimicrobiota bacterium]